MHPELHYKLLGDGPPTPLPPDQRRDLAGLLLMYEQLVPATYEVMVDAYYCPGSVNDATFTFHYRQHHFERGLAKLAEKAIRHIKRGEVPPEFAAIRPHVVARELRSNRCSSRYRELLSGGSLTDTELCEAIRQEHERLAAIGQRGQHTRDLNKAKSKMGIKQ